MTPTNTSPVFNNFSPVSGAEDFDEEEKIDFDKKNGSQTSNTSTHKQPDDNSAKERQQDLVKLDESKNSPVDADFPISSKEYMQQKELEDFDVPSRPNVTRVKTSDKLSLSDKKASPENCETTDFLQLENEPVFESSQEDDSPGTPKRIDKSEPSRNSTREGNSNSPPASITDTNKVIPKVCIKTIKTKTGQIKHTVTRVPSERIQKAAVSNNEEFRETKCAIFSSPRHSLPITGAPMAAGFVNEVKKQMTIKPVATAFLPVSTVKTVGSQVINLKLANNTTVKATMIPASSIQNTNGIILKATNTIQQQAATTPTSNLVNTRLPKNMHLGNLNFLPQTMAPSACEHQQMFKISQKHKQQQLKIIVSGPTSKKVSKVQMFESSQNSVVDAFNKVLSSINPVPIYVPDLSPPSSACITLPSRGYKCLECGDSFALERSLAQHFGRRSVRIDVTCNQCTKTLVFYNKCSLLSHARSHKDKGTVMQCSHLILKPIPADQMVITTSPTIHRMNSTSNSQTSWNGSQNVPCTLTCEDETSELGGQNHICWECKEMFQDVSSLAVHYQQESKCQKTCSICQMLLPNQCSFLSHQRIHKHKSPFICPECGANCQSAQSQSHHVTKTCLHYTRRNGYRCVHCSVILTDVSTLKTHIQRTHCEIFYKCPICPMAFKSAPGTHSHSNTQHPGVKAGEPMLIYKCAMCDTVFTLQSLLYTHLEQHVNTQGLPVFKCPDCTMYYAQKPLMLDHIKTAHGALKTAEGPPNLGISLPLSTRSTNSNSTSNNIKENENCYVRPDKDLPKRKTARANWNSTSSNGYTCGECSTDYICRATYVGHMRKEHGKILKKHPCHHCEKSFCSVHSLCRHNHLKHKVFTCPQCPTLSQPFPKRILLDQHIQLMHSDKQRKTVKTNITDTAPAKKMASTKRKTEEHEASAVVDCRSLDSQPLKKLKLNIPKVQKCAVCGFNTENITAFHEHIPQHKSNGSSYQCKECGLCYTSPRSLSRHLFIVHRLKEPHRHGHHHSQVTAGDESQGENQLNSADENDDGAPNTRCKVCGREFETEAILNTHMRTHGMAFIKAKASKLRGEKS